MKTVMLFFFLVILTVSCQLKQRESSDNLAFDSGNADIDTCSIDTEKCVVDTIKATAIFWIDKAELKNSKGGGIRTVKAKVFIYEDGKVKLKGFVKKQSIAAEKYIRHHLAKFRVTKLMLDNHYIPLGEQYVQLRYIKPAEK